MLSLKRSSGSHEKNFDLPKGEARDNATVQKAGIKIKTNSSPENFRHHINQKN
jgi:hypothetical protein